MEDTVPPEETAEMKDIRVNKDVAALSYVWILSVVIYASRRDSAFIEHHSKQGLVLFLLSLPLLFIPVIGNVLMLLIIAGELLGFINAANGRRQDVPFIGPLSRGEITLAECSSIVRKEFFRGVEALKKMFTPTPTEQKPDLTQAEDTPQVPKDQAS